MEGDTKARTDQVITACICLYQLKSMKYPSRGVDCVCCAFDSVGIRDVCFGMW